MVKISKVLHFVGDYWYIPAILIATVVGWLLFRWHKPDAQGALQEVQDELDIIRAGAEVRELQIKVGTEQTLQHVKDKYQAKTIALDATQQLKAKELENDPIALAKYLERITR